MGINCIFSGTFPDVLEFARTVKSHSPHLKIATGGIHPTSFPKEILTNCSDIDYVALGEGENAIVDYVKAVKNDTGLPVAGMVYKRNGGGRAGLRRSGMRFRFCGLDRGSPDCPGQVPELIPSDAGLRTEIPD